MENRLKKKVEEYILELKENLKDRIINSSLKDTSECNEIVKYIYDYERLSIDHIDFVKRKRSKNVVPLFERCGALRANNEQCTRRKKKTHDFCGTHLKGSPNGIVNMQNNENNNHNHNNKTSVGIWTQEIKGILYYIDNNNNVYSMNDIMSNKENPRVIASYEKNGEEYNIPYFN
jgi:hypothetical protein